MFWLISWIVYLFGLLPLGLVALISWKKLKGKPERTLQKPDWKKDVVYLFTFPLVPSVRSFSPFALKLETWLRVAGIKYEVVYTMKFSKKGQIPYIELNGEEIADSNIIIKTLKSYFNKNPDSQYSMTDLSLAHSVTSMVENHTALTGFHYRYGYKMKVI
ncbi:failed axon connections [Eurytemora carolleeae]|uniref:failed axon connections n=1 Tax=Eurytemora carolleeae TaxID=1294199 RepID=UPI000C7902A6|nr:failed axon connections [Eurytemora carolleeae]|eukprot:XP_023349687.1 failed axon connections-like [Eurytemora affinis]